MTDGVSIVPDDGGVVMGVLQRPTHAHARREGVELVERDSGADVSRRPARRASSSARRALSGGGNLASSSAPRESRVGSPLSRDGHARMSALMSAALAIARKSAPAPLCALGDGGERLATRTRRPRARVHG